MDVKYGEYKQKFAENNIIDNPSVVCRQIGNAVPCLLGKAIGVAVMISIEKSGEV